MFLEQMSKKTDKFDIIAKEASKHPEIEACISPTKKAVIHMRLVREHAVERVPLTSVCRIYGVKYGRARSRVEQDIAGRPYGSKGRPKVFSDAVSAELKVEVDKYVDDDYCITMDFLMYLANTTLAKYDDAYRQGLKRVKRTTLRRWIEEKEYHFGPLKDAYYQAADQPRRVIAAFFTSLDALRNQNKYPLYLIFNMDETWCNVDKGAFRNYVISKQGRVPRAKQPSASVHVTMIGCINAYGDALPPYFLLPHELKSEKEVDKHHLRFVQCAVTPKGYINKTALVEWFTKAFLPFLETRRPNPNVRALLIMDQKSSREDPAFNMVCFQNNVDLVLLPARCTSRLQPLDVAVYGSFKYHFKLALQNGGIYATLDAAVHAFQKAFIGDTIRNAWERSGLIGDHTEVLNQFDDRDPLQTLRPILTGPSRRASSVC